jgi:hypothetical protein
VRQLSSPSPVKAVTVIRMPAQPSVLYWQASYGYTNSADPFLESMSDRTVENGGRWAMPPGAIVCRRVGRQFEPLDLGRPYILFAAPGAEGGPAPQPEELEQAGRAGCTHVLRADSSPRYVRAVRLLPAVTTENPIELPLPQERPASDLRRWVWLGAAPAFDVATLVAIPFVAVWVLLIPGEEPGAAP